MAEYTEWGPLAALIGEWEGNEGVDFAFANARGDTGETNLREKLSMKPFGPVENGTQVLYGLDYRTAAWLKSAVRRGRSARRRGRAAPAWCGRLSVARSSAVPFRRALLRQRVSLRGGPA